MNPLELTAARSALANAIASKTSDGELALPAGVLVQPGDTPATISAQSS